MRPLDAVVFAHGFSWRKRALVRAFAQRQDVRFVRHAGQMTAGASLRLWGSSPAPVGLPEGVQVYRFEDGFVRSVGLGGGCFINYKKKKKKRKKKKKKKRKQNKKKKTGEGEKIK